jgi:hypothetical protein
MDGLMKLDRRFERADTTPSDDVILIRVLAALARF